MGADALTLVLLPGMDGTGRLFGPLIEALGPDARVQVIRRPTTSTAGYRELTDFVRQALPAEGEYVLLGESFSGPIAVSIAAQAPRGLKALVLCCTFVSNPRPGLAPFRPLLPLVPLGRVATALGLRAVLGRFASEPLFTSLRAAVQSVAPGTLRERIKAVIAIDVTADLSRVTVPILYLRATRDRLVPSAAMEAIRNIQSGMELAEIEGPHFLLQACAKPAAARLQQFLLDIGNASPHQGS